MGRQFELLKQVRGWSASQESKETAGREKESLREAVEETREEIFSLTEAINDANKKCVKFTQVAFGFAGCGSCGCECRNCLVLCL